jgi:hypothetical protein
VVGTGLDKSDDGHPSVWGPHGLGVPNERRLLVAVKGQIFVCGVEISILRPGNPRKSIDGESRLSHRPPGNSSKSMLLPDWRQSAESSEGSPHAPL